MATFVKNNANVMQCRVIKTCTLFICFCWLASFTFSASAKDKFIVVLDAGHGGKDPGAMDKTKTKMEKVVALKVALMVGKYIEKNFDDVEVIYTRKSDVFVNLKERAAIANRAGADLFISIHTNAAKNRSAYGVETFTLGASRSDASMAVAMLENQSILLEENYKERYEDFNPTSTESYIMFELIRGKEMEKGISLANMVQNHLVTDAKRHNRGVFQAGFLVIRETLMPSILVELGFISNVNEAKYLFSDKGIKEQSNSIYLGFCDYYQQYLLIQKGNSPKTVVAPETEHQTISDDEPLFKVQFLASETIIKSGDKRLKGLPAEYYEENGLYKYTYGETADYEEIKRLRKNILGKFKEAFVIAFLNGNRVDVNEALSKKKKKK